MKQKQDKADDHVVGAERLALFTLAMMIIATAIFEATKRLAAEEPHQRKAVPEMLAPGPVDSRLAAYDARSSSATTPNEELTTCEKTAFSLTCR